MQTRTVIYLTIAILVAAGGLAFSARSLFALRGDALIATPLMRSARDDHANTPIPVDERPAMPDYQRDLEFHHSPSESERADLLSKLDDLISLLNKDPENLNAWIQLGHVRMAAGDPAGAKQIWEYTAQVWPANKVSFNILGDFCTDVRKNYDKGEASYLTAVRNDPTNPAPYRSLFRLYHTIGYKGAGTAEDILKQGIAAIPTAIDLRVLLADYYRDTGRTAEAKTQYDLAISNAKSQGQTSLAASIQTKRDAF